MKNKSILIGSIIAAIVIVFGLIFIFNGKRVESDIKTVTDIKRMFNKIYKGVNLPETETEAIETTSDNVEAYTGLKSNSNIEKMVVSEPFINAQAYSAVALIVKEGSDIEKIKQEILENINMNKWICVSAEQLYITNNGNVIFLVMSDEDQAKPVYDNFKKYVNNNIGKELTKTEGGNLLDDLDIKFIMTECRKHSIDRLTNNDTKKTRKKILNFHQNYQHHKKHLKGALILRRKHAIFKYKLFILFFTSSFIILFHCSPKI